MNQINKIIRISILSIKKEFAYPIKLVTEILLMIIDIFIFYSIWKSIYGGENIFGNINYEQIITYIILARILYQMMAWGQNLSISKVIRNGDITMELIRPLSFQFFQYILKIGQFIKDILVIIIPGIIIGMFIGLKAPVSSLNMMLFVLSVFGAITIIFMVDFIVACVTFYTVSSWGLQVFKQAMFAFFSGSLIPITLMPDVLQKIVNVLPFKSMVYFPISIYIGTIDYKEILNGFIIQIVWIISLFIISKIFYNISLRKVTIAGG